MNSNLFNTSDFHVMISWFLEYKIRFITWKTFKNSASGCVGLRIQIAANTQIITWNRFTLVFGVKIWREIHNVGSVYTRFWRQDMERTSQLGVGLHSFLASRYGEKIITRSWLALMSVFPYLDAKSERKPTPRCEFLFIS